MVQEESLATTLRGGASTMLMLERDGTLVRNNAKVLLLHAIKGAIRRLLSYGIARRSDVAQ